MTTKNLPMLLPLKRPWNHGLVLGQKRALLPKHVWAIRARLELQDCIRDLALFNLGIDSKLRGCDLVAIKVGDVFVNGRVKERATIIQSKTSSPVHFEITKTAPDALGRWLSEPHMLRSKYLWPSRLGTRNHLSTRQYARLLKKWVQSINFEPSAYGTHSVRRTKAAQIYKKTGNLRAVQLLLGHSKMDCTVRYLGIDLEDALEISESIDI